MTGRIHYRDLLIDDWYFRQYKNLNLDNFIKRKEERFLLDLEWTCILYREDCLDIITNLSLTDYLEELTNKKEKAIKKAQKIAKNDFLEWS